MNLFLPWNTKGNGLSDVYTALYHLLSGTNLDNFSGVFWHMMVHFNFLLQSCKFETKIIEICFTGKLYSSISCLIQCVACHFFVNMCEIY